jgi:hypothetical protein
MPHCDTCQHTYHWNCLTDLNACSHTARQDAEDSEDCHCPACNDLTQAEKDTRKSYAEEKEMIKVIWQPTWEAAELLLANPDFKTYVDSYENADTSTQLNTQSEDQEIDILLSTRRSTLVLGGEYNRTLVSTLLAQLALC